MAQVAEWLTFLNRLKALPKPATVHDQMLAEFRAFMEEDRVCRRLQFTFEEETWAA